MKKCLLLLVLFCGYFVTAQEIAIKTSKSEVFKDKKKNTSLLFSEQDGQGGFITLREYRGGLMQMPKGYYLDHYDANLNLLKETEIEIDDNEIKGLMVRDGSIYVLESYLDRKGDVYQFNVLESPLNSFDFKKRTLFTLNEDEVKKYFGVVLGIFFLNNGVDQSDSNRMGEVTFSAKKNFFCVNFDIKDKDSQTQRLYVYDNDFNQVFTKEFKRDIKDRLFNYENIDVDDKTGELYLLGKIYENNSTQTKKKGKANYHYELHKISADDHKEVSFGTGENFIGSLFTVRGENGLSCAGFYSEKNDHRYKGVCRFNLDPETLEISTSSYMPFSEEFITDKYGKVKDKDLRNLSLRSAFITENGDIVLNAEEFFITHQSHMSMNGGMHTTTTYHFNDIVSVKMSRDGKLIWARNINKRQATAGVAQEYLSFSSTVVGEDTFIFINCSDKIRSIRKDRLEFKQGSIKKSNFYAIKIDNSGNYTFKSIVDDKDTEVPYFVKQGIPLTLDGTEMVFIGRKNSKKQFLKIEIAE